MEGIEQQDFWKGTFGDEYTIRNAGDWNNFYKKQWGVTRTELNNEFLKGVDKRLPVLEVGCNRGNQLKLLKRDGFTNLWGVEINKSALDLAREDKGFNVVEASALDLPFRDGFFNLVFTSGVLIHIAPSNLPKAIDEICRVSNRYIWGFEYFSEKCGEIEYKGHKNKLWKNNFSKLFLERHPRLSLLRQKKIKYVDNDNIDEMFILEKPQKK